MDYDKQTDNNVSNAGFHPEQNKGRLNPNIVKRKTIFYLLRNNSKVALKAKDTTYLQSSLGMVI